MSDFLKYGLFLFCFFSHVLGAYGQLGYGIKGGLNISDVVINNVIDPDGESDYNMKLGMHGGVFCFVDGDSRVGLAAELLYSNKGVKAISNINLHYINLPVLLRYAVRERLIAEAGPEAGYLIVARSKYGNVSNVWNNKLDLGLNLGFQYNLTDKLIAGMRFNAGFASVVKTGFNSSGEKVRYQNRVLQFSLGYRVNSMSSEKSGTRKVKMRPRGYRQ